MPSASGLLLRRGPDDDSTHHEFGGFFYSDEGRTIRYGILLGIIFVFLAFVIISYQHATIRLRQGLAPLPYHRWLVSRKRREQFEPQSGDQTQPTPPEDNFSFYQYEHALHPVPPPAYNPNYVQPPAYSGPPAGATKTPPQQYRAPSSEEPIAGPSSTAGQRS